MLKVNSLSMMQPYQSEVNFKSDNVTRKSQYSSNVSYDTDFVQDDFKRIQKEQKKQKTKNNIMMILSATASAAIIGMCGMAMFGKGGLNSLRSKTEQEALKIKPIDLSQIKERSKDSYSQEVKNFLKKLEGLLTRSDIEAKGGQRVCQVQLAGPGGTGKTDVAGVIAKKINELFPGSEYYVPDLSMLSSSSYKGQDVQMLTEYTNAISAQADKLIAESKTSGKKKYLVCFLDEFDKIAMQDHGLGQHDSNKTVGALKTLINTLMEKDNVILLSATNYPEKIEGAVASRTAEKVLVDYLTPKQTMAAIIEHYKSAENGRVAKDFLDAKNVKLQQICNVISSPEHCMEYRKLFKNIIPSTLINSPENGKIELKNLVEAVISPSVARELKLTNEEITYLKGLVGI